VLRITFSVQHHGFHVQRTFAMHIYARDIHLRNALFCGNACPFAQPREAGFLRHSASPAPVIPSPPPKRAKTADSSGDSSPSATKALSASPRQRRPNSIMQSSGSTWTLLPSARSMELRPPAGFSHPAHSQEATGDHVSCATRSEDHPKRAA
jgi:hypothetical protein